MPGIPLCQQCSTPLTRNRRGWGLLGDALFCGVWCARRYFAAAARAARGQAPR